MSAEIRKHVPTILKDDYYPLDRLTPAQRDTLLASNEKAEAWVKEKCAVLLWKEHNNEPIPTGIALIDVLLDIAHERIDLSLFLKFGHRKQLFGQLRKLELAAQRDAMDKGVKIVAWKDEKVTHRIKQLTTEERWTAAEIGLVFGERFPRPPEAQAKLMESTEPRLPLPKGPFRADRRRKGVDVSAPCFISVANLVRLLAQLQG